MARIIKGRKASLVHLLFRVRSPHGRLDLCCAFCSVQFESWVLRTFGSFRFSYTVGLQKELEVESGVETRNELFEIADQKDIIGRRQKRGNGRFGEVENV